MSSTRFPVVAAAALFALACSRSAGPDAPPAAPAAEDVRDLPSGTAAVVRLDFGGPSAGVLRTALADAAEGTVGCLGEMAPSLRRATVALVPGPRDLSAALVLEGSFAEDVVRPCAGAVARALALRAPPEGSSPAVVPLGTSGDGSSRFFVALDPETDRAPRGLQGPLAQALASVSGEPVALAVLGGETLRSLSAHAATYLPLSSMSEAADRIEWVAYGIRPRDDGGADVRANVRLADSDAADRLARQIREAGKIVALPGERASWASFRDRLSAVDAVVASDGRTVLATGSLSRDGLLDLLR